MALQIIGYEASTGTLREVYLGVRARLAATSGREGVLRIVEAHGLDAMLIPKVFEAMQTLDGSGPLSWPERELLSVLTSRLNQCGDLAAHHAGLLEVALDGNQDLPRAVLATPRTISPPSSRMRMLAELAVLVTEAPWTLARVHRDRAHEAGLGDDDILHALELVSYVGHVSRIVQAMRLERTLAPPPDLDAPPWPTSPSLLVGKAALETTSRPATGAALAAWRSYMFERDAPLSRRQRTVIARWVAMWLGDGGISAPDDLTVNPLDNALRTMAEVITLAPWRLDDRGFQDLRAAGFDDATLFDACAVASTTGMLSRLSVALSALGR